MSLSAFRVTQGVMVHQSTANLQRNLQRMQDLQNQLSSGRSLNKPSDSPSGTVAALQYRSDIRRSAQYARNADDGLGWLGMADNALTSSLDLVRRVRDLVVQAGNASLDQSGRNAISLEVIQIKQSLLSVANTTFLDRPIFAGTASTATAYDSAGVFLGNNSRVSRNVAPGQQVDVNLDGQATFGDSSAGLLKTLDDIAGHLNSGTPADIATLITTDLNTLDTNRLNLQNQLASVGARYKRVEDMKGRAADSQITLKGGLSEVEDIDLPKTITDLQLQQVAYQAAISATAKVIQPSLVDFLR